MGSETGSGGGARVGTRRVVAELSRWRAAQRLHRRRARRRRDAVMGGCSRCGRSGSLRHGHAAHCVDLWVCVPGALEPPIEQLCATGTAFRSICVVLDRSRSDRALQGGGVCDLAPD
jgi:hypothetical protein